MLYSLQGESHLPVLKLVVVLKKEMGQGPG